MQKKILKLLPIAQYAATSLNSHTSARAAQNAGCFAATDADGEFTIGAGYAETNLKYKELKRLPHLLLPGAQYPEATPRDQQLEQLYDQFEDDHGLFSSCSSSFSPVG